MHFAVHNSLTMHAKNVTTLDSKSVFEIALGKYRSFTQVPEEETLVDRSRRLEQANDYFTLAASACEQLSNKRLAALLSQFEPLSQGITMEESHRAALRLELDFFITQIFT